MRNKRKSTHYTSFTDNHIKNNNAKQKKSFCHYFSLLLLIILMLPASALAQIQDFMTIVYPTQVATGQSFTIDIQGLWGPGFFSDVHNQFTTFTLTCAGLNGTLTKSGAHFFSYPLGGVGFDGLSFSSTGSKTISIQASHATEGTISTTITLNVVAKTAAPNASIDYENEQITGLENGKSYAIHVNGTGGGDAVIAASGTGTIAINSAWMNGTANNFQIFLKGDGSTYVDSEAQTLTIPVRPSAPTPTGVSESFAGAGDAKITGVSTDMEHSTDGTNWTACTGTEIAGLGTGSYQVRMKAVANASFASTAATVAIGANASNAPTLSGPTSMTLAPGYAATSTGAFTATGNPPPTVTKTSGDAAITWNDTTKMLDIAAGLTLGTYPVVLTASNGVGADATHTFTLTVAGDGPTLSGPTEMTLAPGYAATSTAAFSVTGNPLPMVTADTDHGGLITLNLATGTLDIAAGLGVGTYPVTLTASNGVGTDATHTFTLTVKSSPSGSSDYYEPIEDITKYEQAIVVGCKEWANVRSGPGTDTEVVGQVTPGEQIELLQWNADETWCKILYNGGNNLGWLHYKFIKPVK